jgi:parallel beta-helix repeat protein
MRIANLREKQVNGEGGGASRRRTHRVRPAGGKRPLGAFLMLMLLVGGAGSAFGVTFRWAASSSTMYIEGPGSAMLTDVKAALPKAPLTQVAPGVWHLRADLELSEGAKLLLHGTKIGGDVNELRLQSNNNANSNAFVRITADWGALDIRSTKITSWDDEVNGPDLEVWQFGRASIRVRSFLGDDQVTAFESRMDVIDSDIGYLGFHEAESYGLTWKVNPPKNNLEYSPITNLYNYVNSYGDVLNNHIHDNFFGVYTFGAYGMRMANNEVDHNIWYGFDPHDDSDRLVIENNNVHHNGTHGIIASQRCDHLIIRNNTSWANGHAGIMLHRYCDDSLVENNRCLDNADAGIALFDTRRATVRGNTCLRNGLSGIRCCVGAADNLIEGNEFAYSPSLGLYLYKGIDAPMLGDDGHPKRNRFINNRVHHNVGSGLYSIYGDGNFFTGNVFDANNPVMWLINGQGNHFESNTIPAAATVRMQGDPSFLSSTYVRNQPALPIQLDAYSAMTFEDSLGRVFSAQEGGLASIVTPTGTALTLTSADIGKTSTVNVRNLQIIPDAGLVLVTVLSWNTSGDLSKRWTVQAGSAARAISYKIGDLSPNIVFDVFKNGVATKFTADAEGNIAFQDKAVTTGTVEYIVMRH